MNKKPKNNGVRYPHIHVQLSGRDGNAFSILGRVTSALRAAGVSKEEIKKYQDEAMSGNYDHLLGVTMSWVDCR